MDNRNNRLFLDTLEQLTSKGLTEEEAIKAYDDLYGKFDEVNTPKEKYDTAVKYRTPRETIKRQTILGNVKRGSPLNVTDYDAEIQAKAAKVSALKNIGRFGLAPLGAAVSAKDAIENVEKGNYTEAGIDATGVASGVATVLGSGLATPLAIPSMAKGAALLADKYAWDRIPESVQQGGVSALSSSLEKTAEDTPEAEERRKVLKEKFNLNVIPKKDRPVKPAPAEAFTASEIEDLSNPEMVEKEKREKIVKDAIEMSKMNNKNYSDADHQMVGMQALQNYDKGKKLKQNLGELKENVGEFFSDLFKKDPEDIRKAKAEEREKYIKLNQQRIAAGLSPLEIPAGLEEKTYTPTEEDKKPYEFKTKQLAATPAKSSGLSEEGLKFDDLLKQYANYDYKNNLQGVSDEELNELAKGRGEKRNISYIAQTPEGYQGPSPEEVKAEAVNVANKLNQNPAMFLGQIDQESSFNPFAVSKTGAKGLGQMFPAAYTDAQKMDKDGILKNIPYREMIKPENWKLQLYAAGLYNSWIDKYMTKGAGDEARLKWYSGGANEEKAKARGTDPSAYAKAVFRRAKKFEKELGGQMPTAELKDENAPKSVARNPAGFMDEEPEEGEIIPQVTDRTSLDKVQRLKSIQSFLKGETSDTPISFGPYSDTEAGRNLYSGGMKDQNRLLTLKNKYDQMMMDKGKTPSGESINFVPVEGEDGKPMNFVPVEGPDGQPMPSESTPSAIPSQESATTAATAPTTPEAPSVSAQKQADALVAQQTSLQQQLKAAQEQARQSELLGGLGKAAGRILAGGVGFGSKVAVKPAENTEFDRMIEDRDRPIKELEQTIKIQGEDPNSDVSNSMRDILAQDLKDIGIEANLSGLSYNQMKEIYSPISSRISRVEAANLRKEEKAEREKDKAESEKRRVQSGFLERSLGKFSREKEHKALFTLKDAINQIDNYLRNPTPESAGALAYSFPKINDPNSVVRESELKLFGSAGSITDKFKETIQNILKGTVTAEKAKRFRDFVVDKMISNEQIIKTQLNPYIEQGERIGLKPEETISSIAGPEYYKYLFQTLTDGQKTRLEELRAKRDKAIKE